jgi:hypothetical protein
MRKEYAVRLYADEYKAPWLASFVSTGGKTESLGKTTYTSDELKAMRTLKQLDIENRTNTELSNYPEVSIPKYDNHGQLMMHFHSLLMTEDGPIIEAYLRKMMTTGYFDPNMKTVLNKRGVELINKVIEVSTRFVARWITINSGTTVVQIEDANGKVSSANVKDLRFK